MFSLFISLKFMEVFNPKFSYCILEFIVYVEVVYM